MRPAALTNATPDARAFQGRSGLDATLSDDGFDAALAGLVPPSTDIVSTTVGSTAPAPLLPAAGQGIAALLAKLAGGVAAANGAAPTGLKGATVTTVSAGDTTAKKDAVTDDLKTAPPTPTDPLAAMTALLPGLVAVPAVVAAAPTAVKAQADPTKLSAVIGDASAAKPRGARGPNLPGSTDVAPASEPKVGVTLVASSTHLAPVTTAPPPVVPHAADAAAAKDGSKSATPVSIANTDSPAVSPAPDAASRDAAPAAAVASHAAPVAALPDGTLQSLATAVGSLAADIAPAAKESAPVVAAAISDPAPTPVAPARSLTLQLSPGDLGSVTVRLHLTAGGLAVHLAVDDRTTLASLSHARDDLATAIGGNGYRVDSLVIRGADASSTSTAGSHDSARSQTEAGAGQGFSGGGSGGSDGDASSSRRRAPTAAPRDPVRARGDDGVFV